MADDLRSAVFEHTELAALSPAARRLALRSLAFDIGLPDAARAVAEVADEIDGFGVLTDVMRDAAVTDVLVNGCDEVWIDRNGRLERTDLRFRDDGALERAVSGWLGRAGARLDRAHPIADARLGDGSRIHAVLPPVAPNGPLVSIRRFPPSRFDLDDLVERAMLSPSQAGTLRSLVEQRKTIVISGRTGTGKSTLLDALLRCVPKSERVVTIEELPELQPATEHRVSLITRPPNLEGRGAVTMPQLVRAALRMRPDRIVVGEVRGPEALTALEAMATGHDGSMLTLHARSADAVRDRILTLALQSDTGLNERSLQRQIDDAVDVVVHLERNDERRFLSALCTSP